MTESREGLFVREKSPLLEIRAKKSDSYETFVDKAAKKCLVTIQEGKILQLFKLSSARILNEAMSIYGKQKPWTVGNYLLMVRKSASNIKLGVGCIAATQNQSNTLPIPSDELEVLVHFILCYLILLISATLMYRDPHTLLQNCHQDI